MSKDPKEMTNEEKQTRALEIIDIKFEDLTNDERIAYMQEMIGLSKGSLLVVKMEQNPPGTTGVCVMNNNSDIMLRIGATRALMDDVTQELAKNLPEHLVDRLMEQMHGKDGDVQAGLKELLGNDSLGDLLGEGYKARKADSDVGDLPKPSGRFNFNHDD